MATEVRTQTAGNMWRVLVKPGDPVETGDTLFIMEVMKSGPPSERISPHSPALHAGHGWATVADLDWT